MIWIRRARGFFVKRRLTPGLACLRPFGIEYPHGAVQLGVAAEELSLPKSLACLRPFGIEYPHGSVQLGVAAEEDQNVPALYPEVRVRVRLYLPLVHDGYYGRA